MASCVICRTPATDPEKGPSLWARAVIDDEHVLVCPECQRAHPAWIERAERCPGCGSRKLMKSLGDKVCRACGHQWSNDRFTLL
jgi:rRNA maturation endonuclease Nob1